MSTFLRGRNFRAGLESASMGVEYLLMGDGSQNHGQITKGNYRRVQLSFKPNPQRLLD
jgi:hypothetical protein